MTLALWLLPGAIFAVGLIPLLVALRSFRDEARALRGELRGMGDVRLAYLGVASDVDALRSEIGRRTRH